MPLEVLSPTGRPRDIDTKVGDQNPADIEAEGQRSQGQRGPESKSGGFRLAESRPELEDK